MSPFLQTSFHSIKKTQQVISLIDRRMVFLNIGFFCLLFILLFSYVIQMNKASTQGYLLRDLQTNVTELQREQKKLQISTTEARSLEHIAQGVQMLGMVQAEHQQYLLDQDQSFAFGE